MKLGIYICEKCAAIHRELYTINSVRSLKSGDWDDSELRVDRLIRFFNMLTLYIINVQL